MSYCNLGKIITELKKCDRNKIVRWGWSEPYSYRGFYEDLAFRPAENVTVGSMLDHAESAIGRTFHGYKGGEFTMQEYTDCWIAEYGESGGDKIGEILLRYMLQ